MREGGNEERGREAMRREGGIKGIASRILHLTNLRCELAY